MENNIQREIKGILAFVAAIWAVFLLEFALPLTEFGVTPRRLTGLIGIVAMPFLHLNLQHIASNTPPLFVLLLLLSGTNVRSWRVVVELVLLGGSLLWLFGRPATHIGASGLIFSLIAFLIISGIRLRRLVPLIVSIVVACVYGGVLLRGVVPELHSATSWDGHLCGAVAGGILALWWTRAAKSPQPILLDAGSGRLHSLDAAIERRHDLDALRASAMFLGIGLHTSLSFFETPWPVQDSQQNPLFGLFLAAVHGFRMPLFFVISGFFTMMVYRKRGLKGLMKQRAMRILVPLAVGLVTIIPVMGVVSLWAMSTAGSADDGQPSLASSIRAQDQTAIDSFLAAPEQINRVDSKFGVTPLAWAVLVADAPLVERLIESGADVNQGNRDGNTPLHAAAFLGYDQIAELLLSKGADPNKRNPAGEPPIRSITADWNTTEFILKLIGAPVPDRAELEAGRLRVKTVLEGTTSERVTLPSADENTGNWRSAYKALMQSDLFRVELGGRSFHLVNSDILGHLWFLWFLVWLIGMFAVVVGIGGTGPAESVESTSGSTLTPGLLRRLVLSNLRFVWLIPLTLLPQWFMGDSPIQFGPDTSTGLLPQPHLLVYYGLFFGFGVLYYEARDTDFQVGRLWWLMIPLGLFVGLPAWLVTIGNHSAGAVVQAVYVWAMTFGMMGLFRTFLKRESPSLRYLSDASYWFYLAHLPLVIGLQAVVRPWPVNAVTKFLLINVVVTVLLLASYQLLVRHTFIGVVLNGPRKRMTPVPADVPAT